MSLQWPANNTIAGQASAGGDLRCILQRKRRVDSSPGKGVVGPSSGPAEQARPATEEAHWCLKTEPGRLDESESSASAHGRLPCASVPGRTLPQLRNGAGGTLHAERGVPHQTCPAQV